MTSEVSDTPTASPSPQQAGPVRRADAVLGGIVWWACHLGATYWLVPRTCELGSTWPLHAITVVLLALIVRAGVSAVQLQRMGRAAGATPAARRDVFLGWLGLAFAVFFGAVTLAEWSPVLFLDPCW
jgi:hypothetical protein